MADIKALAHEVFPYVVEMRRDFHRNPEPSFEEFRTKMEQAGVEKYKAEVQSQLDAWLTANGKK